MANSSFQTGAGLAEQFQSRAVEACTQSASGTRLFDNSQLDHRRCADLDNPADALDSPVVEKVIGGFDVPFEMLIVEAPPVTTAADALSLAQLAGGVVLCVRSWSSYLSTVDDTMNQLAQVRANVLGMMMT